MRRGGRNPSLAWPERDMLRFSSQSLSRARQAALPNSHRAGEHAHMYLVSTVYATLHSLFSFLSLPQKIPSHVIDFALLAMIKDEIPRSWYTVGSQWAGVEQKNTHE